MDEQEAHDGHPTPPLRRLGALRHRSPRGSGQRVPGPAKPARWPGPDIEESASGPDAAARKTKKATPRAKATQQRTPSAKAEEVEWAEALISEVDALPADQAVRRVGEDDVQAAFEVSAAGRGTSEATA
jgi:hypothetical protein